MSTVATANAAPQRKVGILLFIGIVFLPIIFAWLLLRKGHTTLARVLGFGWLLIFFFWLPNRDQQRTPDGAPVATASVNSAAPATPQEPVDRFSEDTQAITQIETRFKDNRESLKKYYSTPESVKQAGLDIIQLRKV
jgi:hypothetical protein